MIDRMKASDFKDKARFEEGSERFVENRALPNNGRYFVRLYKEKATGRFFQVCAEAGEYQLADGEDFKNSPYLKLDPG